LYLFIILAPKPKTNSNESPASEINCPAAPEFINSDLPLRNVDTLADLATQ